MTDQLDQAQKFEESRRADALRDQALKPAMPFIGSCYNCDAVIDHGLFCDCDCRDDFERRVCAKQLNK